jgi:hypothetical protein
VSSHAAARKSGPHLVTTPSLGSEDGRAEFIARGARIRVLEHMSARGKEHGARFTSARAAAEDWIGGHSFAGV